MQFSGLDWAIMAAFFALSLGIGFASSRKVGTGFAAFFLGGRKMPWWLLGISMVATTFSTDTPNLVADIVRSNGVVGNWVWWAFLLTGMLTVFFYAKLWRRSDVLTDIEFYEIRYSGKLAAFLRGFRAVYLGVFFNLMIMAMVTLAAIKIGGVMMQWSPLQTVLIAASVTVVYSVAGGLTGVLLTDLFQFALAMVGSVGAAVYIVNLPEVGGLGAMLAHPNVQPQLSFLPDFGAMGWKELMPIFIVPLAVQWWSAYYPGSEPGGGGYIAQRMLSAKSERHAVGATLLFNTLHYALRPWPWILVALASLVVFPDVASIGERFPYVAENVVQNDLAYPAMLTFLPSGLLGIVVTSLAAAYMSTMSTQVNWGSSIVVNDVYVRFVNPTASERRQVWVGRLATVALMVAACALALVLSNALQVFTILLQVGAGTGLLLLLRWFWWRINAAAEIAGMVVSFLIAVLFAVTGGLGLEAWAQLTVGVVVTTISWVIVMYATRPTDPAVLRSFYERIRPVGPGWRPVAAATPVSGGTDVTPALLSFLLSVVGVYSLLFSTGYLLYGSTVKGVVFAAVAAACAVGVARLWSKLQYDR